MGLVDVKGGAGREGRRWKMRVLTYVEDNQKNLLVKVTSLWFQRHGILLKRLGHMI
jgi:hypothetical protein